VHTKRALIFINTRDPAPRYGEFVARPREI
jgi:hypothetical protein